MLELKDKTEKECREYINYDANLVFKCKLTIMMASFAIEKYGLQVFLGQEEPVTKDKEDKLLDIIVDKRRDIYRFMERNPKYTEEQLAKVLFRESEYYPR